MLTGPPAASSLAGGATDDPPADGDRQQSSPILHPPPLPRNETGVQRARTLAGRRAWVDVLAVTGDLLHGRTSPHGRWYRILSGEEPSGAGGGDSSGKTKTTQDGEEQEQQSETNELLRLRLAAYLRLRKTVDLAREVERLNLLDDDNDDGEDEDDDDAENDANNNATRDDTSARKRRVGGLPIWVDMSVTILAATSLLYTDPGDPQRCLDALHRIRVEIVNTGLRKRGGGDVVKTKAMPYLNRVDVAIANVHVRRKEWRLALAALDNVMENIEGAVRLEVERRLRLAPGTNDDDDRTKVCEWLTTALIGAARIDIRSRQGWIFLQSGAIPEAERIFALAEQDRTNVEAALNNAEAYSVTNPNSALANGLTSTALIIHTPARCLVNDGLRLLALQDYESSMQCFTDAMENLQRLHTPDMSAAPPYHDEEELAATIGFGSEGSGGPGPSLIAPCLNNLALCALYTCRMHHAVAMMESLVREGPTVFLTERLAFNLCTLYELGSDGPASERKKRVLQLVSKRFFLHDIGSESFRIN